MRYRDLFVQLLILAMVSVATADNIITKDGQTVRGRIREISKDAIRLRTKYGELTIPREDVKKHDPSTYVVELKNGSKIEGRILAETDTEVTIKSSGKTHKLLLTKIKNVTAKKATPRPPKLSLQQLALMHRQAIQQLQAKKYAQAITSYKRILSSVPEDPGALYNLACAYALTNNKDEALKLLEKSIQAGFVDFRHIEADPDLNNLRNEPSYKALFEKKDEYIQASRKTAVKRLSASLKARGIKIEDYKTYTDKERNFIYLHTKSEKELATLRKGMENFAEYQWKHLFPNKPSMPLYIVLLRPQDSRKGLQRGVGGVFNPGANTLICGDMPAYKLLNTNVIIHEFTHALHFADQRARRQQHPIWLVEGLSTLFETSNRSDGNVLPLQNQRLRVVQAAVQAHRSLPWSQLMKMSPPQFMRGAKLCYAQSRYMLMYMYKKGLLQKFYLEYTKADNFKNDKSAGEAFEVVFGKPLAAVESDWKRLVMKQVIPPTPFLGIATATRSGRAVVTQVSPNSAASKAGVKRGDAILACAGKEIRSHEDLIEAVVSQAVGDEIEISIERKGKPLSLTAKLGTRESPKARRRRPRPQAVGYVGLAVEEKDGAIIVKEVSPESAAAKAGIQAGQKIVSCQGKKIKNVREYLALAKRARLGRPFKVELIGEDGKKTEASMMPTALPTTVP